MIMVDDQLNDVQLSFLQALYNLTEGDATRQVSMYDIGKLVGMEKDASAQHAENLIGLGLIEIKTLSGGVGISDAGIEKAQDMGWGGQSANSISLGCATVIADDLRQATDLLVAELKTVTGNLNLPYPVLADLVADIRTVDAQLAHSRPKTAVVRACLQSAAAAVKTGGDSEMAKRLENFTVES